MPIQHLWLALIPLLASGCGLQSSAFAFLSGSVTRVGGGCVPRPFAASPVATCEDIDVSTPPISQECLVAAQPTAGSFVERQLDICRRIVNDGEISLQSERRGGKGRSRFKEHSRCTARFGEVLLHARNGAATADEHSCAVHNANSIVRYVEKCREASGGVHAIRRGLIADIVAALESRSLRQFRVRQIEEAPKGSDFTPEAHDIEIIGRLYYSSIRRTEPFLEEVGLTPDQGGFMALLALCRAVASHTASDAWLGPISKEEAKLDAAVSKHFNGITAPGCRFLFSRRHGIDKPHNGGRAKRLVVAFSSLGNGLVRHEFGGSLAKLNQQLHSNGEEPFDVLFVADPAQSWYQKCSRGHFDGFDEYQRRIRVACQTYNRVSMVGDSMGGSGALLFSHLATESVVAFSPQVKLEDDPHVGRYDIYSAVREGYLRRLLRSVDEAVGANVRVAVHRGMEEVDVGHTDLLLSCLSVSSVRQVEVIEHKDCNHHQLATLLKQEGRLAQILETLLFASRFHILTRVGSLYFGAGLPWTLTEPLLAPFRLRPGRRDNEGPTTPKHRTVAGIERPRARQVQDSLFLTATGVLVPARFRSGRAAANLLEAEEGWGIPV
ncbi:hypothetical protein ACHAXT_005232 [Thalassiosira profunda]